MKLKLKKQTSKTIMMGMILLFFSCKTYTISVDSFREQMINAKKEDMKEVKIINPLSYTNIKYASNNIERIKALDKSGKDVYLDNSPSIELRITRRDNKKYFLYFDTVILENDTLKGGESRFIQGLTNQIPMDDIFKIEIQDGKKDFKYKKN